MTNQLNLIGQRKSRSASRSLTRLEKGRLCIEADGAMDLMQNLSSSMRHELMEECGGGERSGTSWRALLA